MSAYMVGKKEVRPEHLIETRLSGRPITLNACSPLGRCGPLGQGPNYLPKNLINVS